jgi:hypothetical protein
VDRGPNIRLRTSLRPLANYACCGHRKSVRTGEAARRDLELVRLPTDKAIKELRKPRRVR